VITPSLRRPPLLLVLLVSPVRNYLRPPSILVHENRSHDNIPAASQRYQNHSDGKRTLVTWRILLLEQLPCNHSGDVTVAIDTDDQASFAFVRRVICQPCDYDGTASASPGETNMYEAVAQFCIFGNDEDDKADEGEQHGTCYDYRPFMEMVGQVHKGEDAERTTI
jgi:hypothetical protein